MLLRWQFHLKERFKVCHHQLPAAMSQMTVCASGTKHELS